MAWNELPDGTRNRLWCKYCRQQGKPWILGQTCGHVRNARNKRQITQEEVDTALAEFMGDL